MILIGPISLPNQTFLPDVDHLPNIPVLLQQLQTLVVWTIQGSAIDQILRDCGGLKTLKILFSSRSLEPPVFGHNEIVTIDWKRNKEFYTNPRPITFQARKLESVSLAGILPTFDDETKSNIKTLKLFDYTQQLGSGFFEKMVNLTELVVEFTKASDHSPALVEFLRNNPGVCPELKSFKVRKDASQEFTVLATVAKTNCSLASASQAACRYVMYLIFCFPSFIYLFSVPFATHSISPWLHSCYQKRLLKERGFCFGIAPMLKLPRSEVFLNSARRKKLSAFAKSRVPRIFGILIARPLRLNPSVQIMAL